MEFTPYPIIELEIAVVFGATAMLSQWKRLVLATLFASSLTNVRADDPLVKFTSAEGGFSANFPGTPTVERSSRGIIYSVQQADRTYTAMFVGLAKPDEIKSETKLLEASRDLLVKNLNGKDVTSKNITRNGSDGLEFQTEIPQGIHYRSRVYVARGRLYQLFVFGSRDVANSKTADEFLDSFMWTEQSSTATAKPESAWKRFESNGVTVELPGTPAIKKTPDGTSLNITVSHDLATYNLDIISFKQRPDELQDAFNMLHASIIRDFDVVEDKQLILGKFHGREIFTKSGAHAITNRTYVADDLLVILRVVTELNSNATHADKKRFFDSLQLQEKPQTEPEK